MSFFDISHLSCRFDVKDENGDVLMTNTAVDDLSTRIEKGTFTAILGTNGSGKSTLARHLNALLVPDEGTVIVDGMNTADADNLLPVREKVGMVFQNPDNQIIASVVEEDVGFGPENISVPTDEIWKRVSDSLQRVGMTSFRRYSPNKLSGGQKQRVAIAGILAMKPQCMILDEPTAMLDPQGRRSLIDTVVELNHREKVTIVLITHFIDEAVRADRIIVMHNGTIRMDGAPRTVLQDEQKLAQLGLELPQAAKLGAMLREGGIDLPAGILDGRELTDEIIKAWKRAGH